MFRNSKKDEGISLKTVHLALIVGAAIISTVMIFLTFQLTDSFRNLANASEQQIELRKAARELMDYSDYLTEKVQRFTITGDRQFMDDFFEEALKSHHREEAIQKMSEATEASEALEELSKAMDASLDLMDTEYYAMKLVVDAQSITDYPEVLDSIVLTSQDQELSDEDKMSKASQLVHNDDYYNQKTIIRENMNNSLSKLETMAYDTDASAIGDLGKEMIIIRFAIMLQIGIMIFMVWLTSRLGIHPVLNAVNSIKSDRKIKESGANEFRYLARAYNKMYDAYKKSLENLNYKASHDPLTGAYNRAGYKLLMSSIDLNSTYMMLFDIDNFKTINDTYGHEIGDKVLVKLVNVMKNNFRDDDCICRIGGDEFVILMVHSAKVNQDMIAKKIDIINKELENSNDGLPATSISVGIIHGKDTTSAEDLYTKADETMYQSKQKGKKTYTFYEKKD